MEHVQKLPAEIPKPANGWFSFQLLLDHYSPAALMTALENSGVFVLDSTGRFVLAADGDPNSSYSKQYAVKLLEAHYAELQNPGPEYSWQTERWDTEPHPTYFFGWPREYLPVLPADGPIIIPPSRDTKVPWTERTAEEFKSEKNTAGSYAKAAEIHQVTRQRYTEVYNKVVYRRK